MFTNIHKTNKSAWYPYPEDSKTHEDMLSTEKLASLRFEHGNVIDLWMVKFTTMETEETLVENIVGWVKNNIDDDWYKYLRTIALMLIVKYIMLVMSMSAGNVYKLTITTMMCSIFTFKIEDMESENKKYELVCCPNQKPLSLEDLVLYMYIDSKKDGKAVDVEIWEKKAKSPLILSLSQLHPDIHTTESLYIIFVELPESRFVVTPGSLMLNIFAAMLALLFQ